MNLFSRDLYDWMLLRQSSYKCQYNFYKCLSAFKLRYEIKGHVVKQFFGQNKEYGIIKSNNKTSRNENVICQMRWSTSKKGKINITR